MAKTIENPKRFIISCRVDDEEMRILRWRAQKAGVSISKLLRNCLDLPDLERRRQYPPTRKQACG